MVWKCDNCDTCNDENLERCIVCDQPRPSKITSGHVEELSVKEVSRNKEEDTAILDKASPPCEESVSASEEPSPGSKEESVPSEDNRLFWTVFAALVLVSLVGGAIFPRLLIIIHIIMLVISTILIILCISEKNDEFLCVLIFSMPISIASLSYMWVVGKLKASSIVMAKAIAHFNYMSIFWLAATIGCLITALLISSSQNEDTKKHLPVIKIALVFTIIGCILGKLMAKVFD